MKKGDLFFGIFFFYIALFSQENANEPVIRYPTGTYLVETVPRDGLGELTIRNDMKNWDAVGVLTLPDTTIVLAVYIRARDKVKIEGIRNGTYHLWFAHGTEWAPQSFRFKKDSSYERFESALVFQTIEDADRIIYSSFEVTLYGVLHGNARTDEVPPALFPKPVR